ncbi:predicted protein [Micromonas commoda]|uniref:GRIP domain-containing protein n=1 Tax=Micromonas commoda (strain RCC299 / NOUM17 / CCMP2709) TaxID=296587 RepID=C1E7C7_MICCC|nr:predicted protein [Micromonas commoda]ACO63585.1 predicted protein [Micromonas commoda]|eukprot:XP_002502327.1 predicted protein [Micromonas commoda]
MAGIGLDWMGNPAAPPPAAAESEEGEPAEEVEPSASAPPTIAQIAEEHEERPAEETSETAADPDPRSPVPVSIAPGDVREPNADAEPAGGKRNDDDDDDDDDDDVIDEVEFVRVPLASAQRLKILDRGPKEELERMHAQDRGGMLTEIRVCKALLRQAYPLMSSEELDETLRKHVAKQRAKADPSIDVSRVPLPSITNEAMDDGMARTLLVSARERLLERERSFEDAASRAEAKMEAKIATLDRLREEADARAAAARDEVSALRAKLERANETAAIASSGAVSSSPFFASNTKTSGADGAFGSRLTPSVALVVNVFDGAQPSEDLREAAREAQTSLIALKLERDAATALAKETGELATRSADRIDELDGSIRTLTKDLADAREEAESWRRVADSAKTAGAQRAEASARDASDRERRLQQRAAALENDLRVANSKTQRLERSLATTKELADKALADERLKLDAVHERMNADLEGLRTERDAAVESLRVELLEAREAASDAELRAKEAEAASDALRYEMEETLESSYNSPTKKAAELELERMKKRLADAERRVQALTEEASEREREMSSTSVSKVEGGDDKLIEGDDKLIEGDDELIEGDDKLIEADQPTSAFDESSPASIARLAAERDAYRRRAEAAEKKAEAAALLMRPVPMTDELRQMREAATKGEAAEAKTAGLEAALRDAVESLRDARVAAHDSSEALRRERSEFDLWRERARGLMEEKDAELDALRRRLFGGDGHHLETASFRETNGTTHAMSAEDFEHFKGAMLRFLLAEDYATQQAMMPVLAALLRFDEDEAVKVGASREKWEPVDVTIGKQLPESFEQAANSLTDTLGLGKLF